MSIDTIIRTVGITAGLALVADLGLLVWLSQHCPNLAGC